MLPSRFLIAKYSQPTPFSHTLHHENFASERHVAVKNDAIMICSILALLKKDLPTPVDQDLNVFPLCLRLIEQSASRKAILPEARTFKAPYPISACLVNPTMTAPTASPSADHVGTPRKSHSWVLGPRRGKRARATDAHHLESL